MFSIGKKYWFVLKTKNEKEVSIKGEAVEENSFFIKIKRDDGNEEIIPFTRILNVNEAKEQDLL